MEALFNIDDGYFEGLIRGFRSGILRNADYLNLCQCETLEGTFAVFSLAGLRRCRSWDRRGQRTRVPARRSPRGLGFACVCRADLKLNIQATDYGNLLANETGALSVSVVDERLRDKLVGEFRHIRHQAAEPLATFLDFISYSYMIDNVIFLLTGTRHHRDIQEVGACAVVWGGFMTRRLSLTFPPPRR